MLFFVTVDKDVSIFEDKKVLLRERKRHTARRVAIGGGGDGGGTPHQTWGTLDMGYPPPRHEVPPGHEVPPQT